MFLFGRDEDLNSYFADPWSNLALKLSFKSNVKASRFLPVKNGWDNSISAEGLKLYVSVHKETKSAKSLPNN